MLWRADQWPSGAITQNDLLGVCPTLIGTAPTSVQIERFY